MLCFPGIGAVVALGAAALVCAGVFGYKMLSKKGEEDFDDDTKKLSKDITVEEASMALASSMGDKKSTKEDKKEAEEMFKILHRSVYDEDGNKRNPEQQKQWLKDNTTDEQRAKLEYVCGKVGKKTDNWDEIRKMHDKAKSLTPSDIEKFDSSLKELSQKTNTPTGEKTEEDLDKEVKQQMVNDEIAKLKETDDFKNKSQEEQEKAIEDVIKKAENDYNNLSDEDKKKKREELKNKQSNSGKGNNQGGEKKLTDEEIENLQNELSELDPENDKDKIKEIEDKLKKAAKDNNASEEEYLVKTDKDKDGKPRQRKTGPRGGKYYRVKGNDGWGPWNSGIGEGLVAYLLKEIL